MTPALYLASASTIRHNLLVAAGLAVTVQPMRIDEETIRHSLGAEDATPRDIADALAEMKAAKLAERQPEALVLGCDQVLDFKGKIFGKPKTADEAETQLRALRGHTHKLLSAAVLYHERKPIWRHVGEARLTMNSFSDGYLVEYLSRNWPEIGHSVGGYKLEEEGVRLFSRIDGDYFTILGLPLLPLLSYLGQRGFIAT